MAKKITQKQQQIINVLNQHDGALSAAEIHRQTDGVDLATVYRALDKLSEERVIKKLVLDGKKALYEYTDHAHHHAVCDHCDEVIHFHLDESKLQELVSVPGFDINDIEIIVRGKHT